MSNLDDKMATLVADLKAEEASITTLTGAIGSIVAAAVTDALKAADADDATVAAALDAADASVRAHISELDAAATAATAPPPTPAPEPTPAPVAAVVTVDAQSITGVSGTPVSGQFSASGGAAPFTFAQTGTVGDFTTTPDGFYAMNPPAGAPVTGSVDIVATDANGIVSEPMTVSISIS